MYFHQVAFKKQKKKKAAPMSGDLFTTRLLGLIVTVKRVKANLNTRSRQLTDLWAEAVTINGRQGRAEVSSTVQVVMGGV